MFVTCKLRLCWWSKVRWSDSWFSMDDAFVDRKAICCVVNTEEVFWGNHCPGLIGGILRDNEGRTLLIFSRSMGLTDPMLAEVIVLKETICVFTASKWLGKNKLIVESNCNNDSYIVSLCLAFPGSREMEIRLVPRDANGTADRLAKAGNNRPSDLLSVCS
ncbi:hypothetical protein ES288_D01G262900v1 [Gossypium darwinii]|uniref:RNase H type-1 domain-containing protein n=1 Tax=Gossypium darwinii TaxID=34276 RepID=A0A5D2DUL7_GOSDA|nr:hypothetical protein ES288_D01G262900v1 [Gossypium darwinii]